jgi:bacillithiol biosynthesis cysteine-adding enzyme BshC
LAKLNYKVQAHTRDVNLFYINNNQRQRILKNNNHLLIEGNKNKLDQKNIIKRIENNPEKFSPNVLFRTMYQEYLLPNLCYIGGPAEVSYWLQLKKSFEMLKITFPILLNRNSVLLISSRQMKKLKKLNIEIEDIFLDLNELTTKKTKEFSELDIDFSELKNVLKDQFKYLFDIASQTDHSFTGAVKAQEKKQLDGIIHLEKRLLSAQKKKFSDHLSRIIELKKELFPFETLQERRINFSEFYCEYGYNIIERLKKNINPLNMSFSVIVID